MDCPVTARPTVIVISDSLGDTACEVVLAASGQFDEGAFRVLRLPKVTSVEQVESFVGPRVDADHRDIAVFHTIVDPALRARVLDYLGLLHIRSVDLIGPTLAVLSSLIGVAPKGVAGVIHKTDDRYFHRIEAMEYFVEHDDGRGCDDLSGADIVLLGVSRTSKTPLSMYLAYQGYKVANVPLAHGMEPPKSIYEVDPMRLFGLISTVDVISEIRDSRLGDDYARVVAGIRNTEPIADLKTTPGLESAGEELERVFLTLEDHYRDMCDIEFTIEQGKLWMLQTRVGKRTATAALRIAIEMVEEGLITREEAVSRIDPAQLDQLLHPQFDSSKKYEALATGLNASPGAAVGEVVFSSDDAVARSAEGHKVILVRWETNPDDLKGMVAAEGILTSHGGKTSHAAVIARGMGTPCVCGVERFHIDAAEKVVHIEGSDRVLHEGDIISIDGTQGIVVDGAVDLVSAELTGDLDTILSWADEIRLNETDGHANHVRVNADNPEDAALALEFGAEAIGLCRTEHMFLGDRKNIIQSFILSDDEAVKQQALVDLLKVQTEDFLAMFKTMSGRDVVVRLLDPPLHEFLDDPRGLEVAITKKEAAGASEEELAVLRARLRRIDGMVESNPMLGLRGVRLSVVFSDLPLMQVRAVATAAARLIKEGVDPRPEIMVPLVSITSEHVQTREVIERVIAEVSAEEGVELNIPVGTMLELPRACMVADEIAQHADFFCFGTNDLTQTTFGFSRDDAEAKFIPLYLHKKILKENPFETIDTAVLELVRMAVEKGRATNPGMHFGVCGEHGGDPKSIKDLFNVADVDYVSCSPYRVPLARLAAAQAKLEAKRSA